MLWQHGEEGDALFKDWSDNTLVYCVVVFGKNDHVWVAVRGLQCRLSLLTNSALVYESKGGGIAGSQPMSTAVHIP